jgi:membrane-bound serine protease (ClpP class)
LGTAVAAVFEEGKVLIHGEYWSAVSDVPVAKGTKIRVIRVEHLKVRIEPIEK